MIRPYRLRFSAALAVEACKLRHSLALLLAVAAPVLIAVFVLFNGLRLETAMPWDTMLRSSAVIWAFFMLPMSVTALTTLVAHAEHGPRTWDHLRSLPLSRWHVHAAKAVCVLGVIAAMSLLLALLSALAIQAAGWWKPAVVATGARYNEATLKVRWNGRSIADVLRMTVDEARDFFAEEEAVARPLQLLREIGLGYLRLGQPATELSGGEAQRIKLATELQRSQRGRSLYVLDEPTTGLHASDADRLLVQLQRLVDAGNTVVMIEHDMRAVTQADWVIDVGPGAGDAGGRIVAAGTPQQVARAPQSRTAPFFAQALARTGADDRC